MKNRNQGLGSMNRSTTHLQETRPEDQEQVERSWKPRSRGKTKTNRREVNDSVIPTAH